MQKLIYMALLVFVWCLPGLAQPPEFKTPQELADADGKFAEIAETTIYYVVRGDATHPAVILIHGFGGSTFTWRDNMDALVDAGYYVIALDLPPFGLSDKGADLPYTRSWMADTVAALMDELGVETATIVGHSMGGAVTAYFAVQYPERVDNLVFVAGGIFEAVASDTAQEDESASPFALLNSIDPTSPFAAILMRTLLTPEVFTDILSSAYHNQAVVTDEVAAGYQRPLQIEDWAVGFLAYQQAEDDTPVTLAELAATNLRTLIVWGAADTWVNIELGQAMNAALDDVQMITYPDVGHLPMEETPLTFNADLIAFLQGN
jgi:pimeloyl-ACP methyl ester carboxylesterase